MIKVQRPMWETEDGKFFDSWDLAYKHELAIKIHRFVMETGMGRGGDWGPDRIAEALLEHESVIFSIFCSNSQPEVARDVKN